MKNEQTTMIPIIIPMLFLLCCFMSSHRYNSIKTNPKRGVILIHSLFVNRFKMINGLQEIINPQKPIFLHIRPPLIPFLGLIVLHHPFFILTITVHEISLFFFFYTHILSLLSYNKLHECLRM